MTSVDSQTSNDTDTFINFLFFTDIMRYMHCFVLFSFRKHVPFSNRFPVLSIISSAEATLIAMICTANESKNYNVLTLLYFQS